MKKGQKRCCSQIREDDVPTQNELLAFEDKDNILLFLTILNRPKAEYSFPNIKRKPVPKKSKRNYLLKMSCNSKKGEKKGKKSVHWKNNNKFERASKGCWWSHCPVHKTKHWLSFKTAQSLSSDDPRGDMREMQRERLRWIWLTVSRSLWRLRNCWPDI